MIAGLMFMTGMETRWSCLRNRMSLACWHPAMELKGVQARFQDTERGLEVRPASFSHQISDYVMGALNAGLRIVELSEYAVDSALVAQSQRAEKHLGWPLLLLMKLSPDD